MGKICLTFDVEEFSIIDDHIQGSNHSDSTKFSVDGLSKILDLLSEKRIKSTFFVTGFFAEKESKIVKRIFDEGHEVASHAYRDRNHSSFGEHEIFKSVGKSKDILEKIIGVKVKGFRMPQFSVNKHMYSVLKRLGFVYDSSFHPAVVLGHYYNFFMPRRVHELANGLFEIPVSVLPFLRLPISWIWMRNLGNWLVDMGVWANFRQGNPAVLYFHSWEFTKLPRVKVPFYVTRNCGEKFAGQIGRFIEDFKKHDFLRLIDLVEG